jgi:hypothetical protein
MIKTKPIHHTAIPAALKRAERYRLLNEPFLAESICLDILEIEPKNQEAIYTLLLAQTDQFGQNRAPALKEVLALIDRIDDDYHRIYYEGVTYERQAKASLKKGTPGARHTAYEFLHKAMDLYQRAEPLRPEDNDEAILRWNTCARLLNRHPELEPAEEHSTPQLLE